MNLTYSPELIEYMQKKQKTNIMVEVVSSNTSDFDVTEICLRFIPDKFADRLIEKDRYRAVEAPVGRLIMPPYRLEIAQEVCFYLKKFLFMNLIKQNGIKL